MVANIRRNPKGVLGVREHDSAADEEVLLPSKHML